MNNKIINLEKRSHFQIAHEIYLSKKSAQEQITSWHPFLLIQSLAGHSMKAFIKELDISLGTPYEKGIPYALETNKINLLVRLNLG